jgi:hypothetical protein
LRQMQRPAASRIFIGEKKTPPAEFASRRTFFFPFRLFWSGLV